METHPTLSPSFFDQLVSISLDLPPRDSKSETAFISSLRLDIETLLNTRLTRRGIESYPQLQKSILGFGIPDTQAFDLETPEARFRLAQTIESVIETFEPRVAEAVVEIWEDGIRAHNLNMNIRVRLDAPMAREIEFETNLKLATGQYQILDTQTVAHR